MANAVYPLFKQSLFTEADANKSLNQTGTNSGFAALVTTSAGYTYSAAHQFYNSLTNIVGTDQEVTSPTVVNGTYDGNDVTYTAVSGTVVGAIVVYRKNSGANTTWRLVLYEDTGVTGLPVTPNGGNIVITWNASGIFTISDMRVKCDIVHIGWLGFLPIYTFRYQHERKASFGMMAQDVERIAPAAVGKVGDRLGVNYDRALELAA